MQAPPPNNTQKVNIYETTVCKILDTRPAKRVRLRDGEPMSSPTASPAHSLESFQPGVFPEWRTQSRESGETSSHSASEREGIPETCRQSSHQPAGH